MSIFLAFFRGSREFLGDKWQDVVVLIYLVIALVAGWVFLSLSGRFPATLIGLSAIILVPVSSYRLFAIMVKPQDRGRIVDILVNH